MIMGGNFGDGTARKNWDAARHVESLTFLLSGTPYFAVSWVRFSPPLVMERHLATPMP